MARGNKKLKKPYLVQEFTPEQIIEFKKCALDPVYFIKRYIRIQHPKKGAIPFELYPYQKKMIRAYQTNRYNIVLSARQTGKSTVAAAYLLWFAMFNRDKTILIASNKNKGAMEIIHRMKYAYEELPMWIKPGVLEDGWNKHTLSFDNGSRVNSTATTEDSGRGESISLLYLDEFAFVRPSIQEEFWTSISPTLSTGGSCIMTSTPNGDSNRFAILWRSSQVDKTTKVVGDDGVEMDIVFHPIHVRWNEPPGRNEAFKRAEIAKIGLLKWRQEYECEFLSSDSLLIDSLALNEITKNIRVPSKKLHDVLFWEEIKENTTYVIGVDPATGSGEDFTVIQVFEFPSMNQVAEFRSNNMLAPYVYNVLKNIIRMIERKNSLPYFSVENNGVGEGIITLYHNDDNPPEEACFISEKGKNRLGMNTNGKTKIRACLNLKDMVEGNRINIRSAMTVKELKAFVRKAGSYQAQLGSTDDCISATLIAIRVLEEISTYEQEAFEKLYVQNYTNWEEDPDSEHAKRRQSPNTSEENDDDAFPIAF